MQGHELSRGKLLLGAGLHGLEIAILQVEHRPDVLQQPRPFRQRLRHGRGGRLEQVGQGFQPGRPRRGERPPDGAQELVVHRQAVMGLGGLGGEHLAYDVLGGHDADGHAPHHHQASRALGQAALEQRRSKGLDDLRLVVLARDEVAVGGPQRDDLGRVDLPLLGVIRRHRHGLRDVGIGDDDDLLRRQRRRTAGDARPEHRAQNHPKRSGHIVLSYYDGAGQPVGGWRMAMGSVRPSGVLRVTYGAWAGDSKTQSAPAKGPRP